MESGGKMAKVYFWPNHQEPVFSYIRTGELDEPERSLFEGWLLGQTRPLLGTEPEDAAYSYDYIRWREQGMKSSQSLAGWD